MLNRWRNRRSRRHDAELTELLRQSVENQRRLIAIAENERAMPPGFLAAAINGTVGGRVGLGRQTPFGPGDGVRY